MSLNWAMLNPDRTPVPLPNESIVKSAVGFADIVLVVPDAVPTASSTSGGSGGNMKFECSSGNLIITDQRLIYTTPSQTSWDSLSVPLISLLSTRFHQPTFGSNYLSIIVKPSSDGGLTPGTSAELRFKDHPMFEFIATLDKTRERAIFMKKELDSEVEGLPTYTSHAVEERGTSRSSVGGVPLDNPPDYQ